MISDIIMKQLMLIGRIYSILIYKNIIIKDLKLIKGMFWGILFSGIVFFTNVERL